MPSRSVTGQLRRRERGLRGLRYTESTLGPGTAPSPPTSMSRILTAEEFVTLVLAKIKLKTDRDFVLEAAVIDRRFEEAYDWLSVREAGLNVISNFTFRCDPLYGVTATFRDALQSLRERRLIQPDSSKRAYRISLSEELAKDYMKHGVLVSEVLDDLVNEIFPEVSAATAA